MNFNKVIFFFKSEYKLASKHAFYKLNIQRKKRTSLRKYRMSAQYTQEQIAEYKEVFRFYDRDNDGVISNYELMAVLNSFGNNFDELDVQKMINKFDIDADGKLNFSDFLLFMSKSYEFQPKASAADFMAYFSFFDKDGDSLISADDLKKSMEVLGQEISDDEIDEMVREVDGDGDGYITCQEFMRALMGY